MKTAVALCLSLLLVAVAVLQLRIALVEQSEFSRADSEISPQRISSNARLLSWQAKQQHLFAADLESADALYQMALTANAYYLPAWLGLAELRIDQGKREEAGDILSYVDTLSANIKRWRWDKALIAYRLGAEEIMARDLSYIIREIPGKTANDACRLALSVWSTPELLKRTLGSNCLPHLFRFAVGEKRVEAAISLWPFVETEDDVVTDRDVYGYVNLLIEKERLSLAARIWKQRYNPNSLVFNGSFEHPPLQTGFGWRARTVKGATWRIDTERDSRGGNAFHLHFDRKENITYQHLYQVVPLAGGLSYTLTSMMKSSRLTTDQLPYLQVSGYRCTTPRFRTEMVNPDQEWTRSELTFSVPEACEAVVIALRRDESVFFDNKLAGDLWLKHVQLTETDDSAIGRVTQQ